MYASIQSIKWQAELLFVYIASIHLIKICPFKITTCQYIQQQCQYSIRQLCDDNAIVITPVERY